MEEKINIFFPSIIDVRLTNSDTFVIQVLRMPVLSLLMGKVQILDTKLFFIYLISINMKLLLPRRCKWIHIYLGLGYFTGKWEI